MRAVRIGILIGMPSPLGFEWEPGDLPRRDPEPSSVERVTWRYLRALPQFVWDAAQLEGNPFTFPEVLTLMDGVTVGGRTLSDETQVLGLINSSRLLAELVRGGTFSLTKSTSDRIHAVLARDEALDAGLFRGEGIERTTPSVFLGEHGRHVPPATEPGAGNLISLHERGLAALEEVPTVTGQAFLYFLFAALHQFYFDGNKRTGRAMMNGQLLSHGLDAISVPAAERGVFNREMVAFYRTKNAGGMLAFLSALADRPDGA